MRKNQDGNPLGDFELYYEDIKEKRVTKAKPVRKNGKVKKKLKIYFPFIVSTESVKNAVTGSIGTFLSKFKKQPKKVKKVTKAQKQEVHEQRKRDILGIGLLFVIVSIIYSTIIVREFVDSAASLVALAPQVTFAGIILVKAFSKLYK